MAAYKNIHTTERSNIREGGAAIALPVSMPNTAKYIYYTHE